MGWGRWLLLGDIGQQLDLQNQSQEIDRLKDEIRRANTRNSKDTADELRRLREDNDELKLYVAALFRLVASKGLATPDELRSLVQAVDAEDGAVDGAHRESVLHSKGEIDGSLADS